MEIKFEINPIPKERYDLKYILNHEGVYRSADDTINRVVTICIEREKIYQTFFVHNNCLEPLFNSAWKHERFVRTSETIKIIFEQK